MQLERLDGDEVIEQNSYNLNWLKIKNEKNSLSVNYAGKKKFFASFLSEDRRKKLKELLRSTAPRLANHIFEGVKAFFL